MHFTILLFLSIILNLASSQKNPFHGPKEVAHRKSGEIRTHISKASNYTGTFLKNKRHGKGTIVYANGDKYEGDWVQDKFEGNGTYTFKSGHIYVGGFKNGKRNGFGVYRGADGDNYTGEWKDNVREGYGVSHAKDGSFYKGNWSLNMRNGEGCLRKTSGDVLCGTFVNNSAEGRCVLWEASGGAHDGYYRNGKKNGLGWWQSAKLTMNSNRTIFGEWKNDIRHGYGDESWSITKYNYERYVDLWRNGVLKGNATWTASIKDKNTGEDIDFEFDGEFDGYKKNGYGVLLTWGLSVYDGYWADDVKHGNGEMTFLKTHQKLVGTWQNDTFYSGKWFKLNDANNVTVGFMGKYRHDLDIFVGSDGSYYKFNFNNGTWQNFERNIF